MSDLSHVRLTLFFTDALSLREWDRVGILDRETALYRAMRPHLGGVTFVTYGDHQDLEYAQGLDGIDVVCNRWHLSAPWYWRYLAGVPGRWKSGKVIFKSNQMPGADTALALAQRFGKPFIARCGYMHAELMACRHGWDSPEARRALDRERRVFQGANRVVVTTPAMHERVTGVHAVPKERVRVIPNYVDLERFFPRPQDVPLSGVPKVLFVGRLDEQKNPLMLLEAVAGLPLELWMVGDGPLRGALEAASARLNLNMRMFGIQSHEVLPGLMREAALFVLPSPHEGHPKALLEAMSCGMPVIGFQDAPGVREVIHTGENGLLCEQTVLGLRHAVERVLEDNALRERLGRGAVSWAVANVGLDRVVQLELSVLEELLTDGVT